MAELETKVFSDSAILLEDSSTGASLLATVGLRDSLEYSVITRAATLSGFIDPKEGTYSIRLLNLKGQPTEMTEAVKESVVEVISESLPTILEAGLPAHLLGRLSLLIADAPSGAHLELAGTTNLVGLCHKVGEQVTVTYDIAGGNQVRRSEPLGPCLKEGCFGRCGAGCGNAPTVRAGGVLIQQFTQDCANHDACVRDLSLSAPSCQDEFSRAADDYLFGPDCNRISGFWGGEIQYTLCGTNGECDSRTFKGRKLIQFSPQLRPELFRNEGRAHRVFGRQTKKRARRGRLTGKWRTSWRIGECSLGRDMSRFTKAQNRCGKIEFVTEGRLPDILVPSGGQCVREGPGGTITRRGTLVRRKKN